MEIVPPVTPEPTLLSVCDLAKALGQDKGTVSRRICKLEAAGKLTPVFIRRNKLVDVAEYERAIAAEMTHQKANATAKRIAAGVPGDVLPAAGIAARTLTEANVENAQLRAEMAKIDLAERRGQVLALTDVQDSMVRCAGVMVRVIDQMPNRAAELFNAATQAGERGVRTVLRTMSTELRETIAREMTVLVDEARTKEAEGPLKVQMDLLEQTDGTLSA
jgi:DNA-binding MarR family transcriptional regulator